MNSTPAEQLVNSTSAEQLVPAGSLALIVSFVVVNPWLI